MTDHMTNADLRRAIAEAQGWKRERREEPIIKYGSYSHSIEGYQTLTIWIAPDGTEHQVSTLYSESLPFPDWPGDLGAALGLCVEIETLAVRIEKVNGMYETSFDIEAIAVYEASDKNLGRSLSLLAWTALKAQAVNA